MYSEIVSAVMDAAARGFEEEGIEITVWQGTAPEERTGPGISVDIREAAETRALGGRARRETTVELIYFPWEAEAAAAERFKAAELMMERLECITLPDGEKLMGIGKSFRRQGEELHFTVNYNLFILRSRLAQPEMEEIRVEKGRMD